MLDGVVLVLFGIDGVTDFIAAGQRCLITAESPLAELFDYAIQLRSITQGKDIFSMEPLVCRVTPHFVQQEVLVRHAWVVSQDQTLGE